MGIGEVHSALGQTVNVRGYGHGGGAVAANPVIHVIDSNEEHIGFFPGETGRCNDQKE